MAKAKKRKHARRIRRCECCFLDTRTWAKVEYTRWLSDHRTGYFCKTCRTTGLSGLLSQGSDNGHAHMVIARVLGRILKQLEGGGLDA